MEFEIPPKNLLALIKELSVYTTKPLISPVWFRVKGEELLSYGVDSTQTILTEYYLKNGKKLFTSIEDGVYQLLPEQMAKVLSTAFVSDPTIKVIYELGEDRSRVILKGQYETYEHELEVGSMKEKAYKIVPSDESGFKIEMLGEGESWIEIPVHAVYKLNADVIYKLNLKGDFLIEYNKNGLKFIVKDAVSKYTRNVPVQVISHNSDGVTGIDLDNFKRVQRFLEGNLYVIFTDFGLVIRRETEEYIRHFLLAGKEVI